MAAENNPTQQTTQTSKQQIFYPKRWSSLVQNRSLPAATPFSGVERLHASAQVSLLVGSQEALLSAALLGELQLYKVGGGKQNKATNKQKSSLYKLFFTLVWVQRGSCTPTLCVTAQRTAKVKSKSASRDKSNDQLIQLHMA